MPTALDSFHRIVLGLIETVYEREQDNLNAAARVMAGRLKEDGLIYVYGSGGHSALGAQEFFYRAGGLVPIYPMFDVNISVLAGAVRSTLIERTPGYARATLEYYGLGPGDVLIITSAYGVNAASVDAAIDGKKMGATVIAITSGDFAGDVALQQAARHPSGQHLADVADLMVDTHVPVGDAVAEVAGLETKMGPVSTILVSYTIQALAIRTAELLLAEGISPPVWVSATVPHGDQVNKGYIARYQGRIKPL